MMENEQCLKRKVGGIVETSKDRFDFCSRIIRELEVKTIAEIGVLQGDFAEQILKQNPSITSYTMVDPWRNLAAWNKPANRDNDTFEAFYQLTLQRTDFAKEKRRVLRGKTTEVIHQIDNASLDMVYIDGDHTLKGITIDLINLWPKLREGGVIVGDDFVPSIWQHDSSFEPTMVFPFAVYFAEAVNATIYALPFGQFLLHKQSNASFEFIDLTNGEYAHLGLRKQFIQQEPEPQGIRRAVMRKIRSAVQTVLPQLMVILSVCICMCYRTHLSVTI